MVRLYGVNDGRLSSGQLKCRIVWIVQQVALAIFLGWWNPIPQLEHQLILIVLHAHLDVIFHFLDEFQILQQTRM